jgi:hypothetical protein
MQNNNRKRTLSINDNNNSSTSLNNNNVKKIKENYKQITGKLISKTALSIDNEFCYSFRIVSENKSCEYYGDLQCFTHMQEGKFYNLSLNFIKTKFTDWIQINEYKECEMNNNSDKCIVEFLNTEQFNNEENVNILAKFKCFYKKLDTNMYKMMFEINYKNLNDDPQIVQIECTANCNRLTSMFKVNDVHELIGYLREKENQIFCMYDVKCQRIVNDFNAYYSWTMTNNTRIEIYGDNEEKQQQQQQQQQEQEQQQQFRIDNKKAFENLKLTHNVQINISRSNKYIGWFNVSEIKTELDEKDVKNCKFIVEFKSGDDEAIEIENAANNGGGGGNGKWIRSMFYVHNKKTEGDVLQKLTADLNQITELLADGLIKVIIYVTIDNVNCSGNFKNINVLSILKYDDCENDYKFL